MIFSCHCLILSNDRVLHKRLAGGPNLDSVLILHGNTKAWSLTSVILAAKHEKNVGYLFCLHSKVSAYCSLKSSDIDKKILVVPDDFSMFSIQDTWC